MDNFFFGTPHASSYNYSAANRVSPADIGAEFIAERRDGFVFVNAENPFFEIGGILTPSENGGEYYRLDASLKDSYTDAHRWLAESTSGGSLRFYTNAKSAIIKVKYRGCNLGMHHFCDRGVFGFDTYVGSGTDRRYIGAMMQTFADNPVENEQKLVMNGDETELLIEFPLYGGIKELTIGLPEECFVSLPAPRSLAPCLFYGSSITQGGCVSRPGTMYSNIICRALDCDNINLGFSGSAFGEQYTAEQIAKRDIACFVMDYDYNSRSTDELSSTHKPFYETVRAGHPDIPVIIVSHPCFKTATETDIIKRDITKATFEFAKSRGDNVRFVDGCDFFPQPTRDLFTVDNLHPNDLGHYYMAKAIYTAIQDAHGAN